MKISERLKDAYSTKRPRDFYSAVPKMPKNLMLELSNACNHTCIFCVNPHMKRKIGRMESGLVHRIMVQARAEGVEEIGFYTTGEPFIHRDLSIFTSSAKCLGFSYIYISTNGALATPKRAKEVIDAGMSSIKFSINAGTRETYKIIHGSDEFDIVLDHLRFISEYRTTLNRPLRLFATFVVTKQNSHEIEGFRALVGPLVDEVYFSTCDNQTGQTVKTHALLAVDPQQAPSGDAICPLPFNRLHVSCEGYLTLCCADYHNYLAIADLAEMTIGEAWRSEAFQAARQRHLEKDLIGTLCGNCWLGRCDAIAPLDARLNSPIDIVDFNEQGAIDTRKRLGL